MRNETREALKETPRQIQLKCLKNRFGVLFDLYFKYYPPIDYFEPATKEEFEPVEEPPKPDNKSKAVAEL